MLYITNSTGLLRRTGRLATISLLIGTCALVLNGCDKGSAKDAVEAATAAIPVQVDRPSRGEMLSVYAGTAPLQADQEATVVAKVGGEVREILVEEGDIVKAGQVLARLDPADYQLAVSAAADQVQAASVDAQQAASDEARFRRLLADGSVGAADHERQKARADAAAARLDQARRQLELARNREGYAALVAPYAGVVTAIRFERGQVVAEGQNVLSLAREGEREIVAELPEDWVGRARTLIASATPWQESKPPVPLLLRELSPLASAQGRTFRARYAATAQSRAQVAALPLGSTMQLNLSAPAAGGAVAVLPVTAVVKASGSAGVWVLNAKGSGVAFTPVQVVALDDATVQVAGLAAGARVVSVGAQKLDAGMTVRAIERSGDTAPTVIGKTGP